MRFARNAHDGMTVSFHHHFREGDLVVNMVMEEIHKMGLKNITVSASSLGKAHAPLVPMIEDGTITNIESSGVRGEIGEAISTGETHVNIAFIGTPTCDDYGNCRGIGGKADCGVAVNPARPDILEALKKADCIPLKTIDELRDIAYNIVGEPDPVAFEDRVVGIIEARDSTILDVVRKAKTRKL